jgi:AraC-like DNA-binding protein
VTSKDKTEQSPWQPENLMPRIPVSKVYVCGRQVEPPLYSHVVNFPRLEVPLSGCYENEIESDKGAVNIRLAPGDALFAAPNCWNLPTWRHKVQLMSLLFGKKQIGISIVSSNGSANPTLTAQKFSIPRPLTGPLPKILDAMVELQMGGGPLAAFPDLARALLLCVQESVRQPAPPTGTRAMSLMEDVCVFLQNHYQYDITRDSVARQFSISPNHLSRIFQLHGHMTFSNYLMHVRTDRAKHLLRSYNLKLDDVAARCGYRDTAYFCRVFKKLAKMTPAAYRAQRK